MLRNKGWKMTGTVHYVKSMTIQIRIIRFVCGIYITEKDKKETVRSYRFLIHTHSPIQWMVETWRETREHGSQTRESTRKLVRVCELAQKTWLDRKKNRNRSLSVKIEPNRSEFTIPAARSLFISYSSFLCWTFYAFNFSARNSLLFSLSQHKTPKSSALNPKIFSSLLSSKPLNILFSAQNPQNRQFWVRWPPPQDHSCCSHPSCRH